MSRPTFAAAPAARPMPRRAPRGVGGNCAREARVPRARAPLRRAGRPRVPRLRERRGFPRHRRAALRAARLARRRVSHAPRAPRRASLPPSARTSSAPLAEVRAAIGVERWARASAASAGEPVELREHECDGATRASIAAVSTMSWLVAPRWTYPPPRRRACCGARGRAAPPGSRPRGRRLRGAPCRRARRGTPLRSERRRPSGRGRPRRPPSRGRVPRRASPAATPDRDRVAQVLRDEDGRKRRHTAKNVVRPAPWRTTSKRKRATSAARRGPAPPVRARGALGPRRSRSPRRGSTFGSPRASRGPERRRRRGDAAPGAARPPMGRGRVSP